MWDRKSLVLILALVVLLVAVVLTACAKTTPLSNWKINFDRLLQQAESFNGQNVSVEGYYISGFEISAFCGELEPSTSSPGNQAPATDLVWIQGSLPEAVSSGLYEQHDIPTGYPQYFGKVEITGLFETGNYGHLNAYKYRLTISDAELISWSPYGSIRVLVTDSNGMPLAGAKVISENQPAGQLKVTGSTGQDGLVHYENLRPGQYAFYISRFDYIYQEFTASVTVGETASISVVLIKEGEAADDIISTTGSSAYRANIQDAGVVNP